MLKKLCILMALSIPFVDPSNSWSADWNRLFETSEETCYSDLDLASRQKQNEREARELTVYRNHKELSRQLEYIEYDCNSKKRRTIQTLTYQKNGEVTLITKPHAAWGTVASDSKAKAFFEAACNR